MACTVCGEQLGVGATTCPACGAAAPLLESPPEATWDGSEAVTTQPWPPPPLPRQNRPTSVRTSPPPTPPTRAFPGSEPTPDTTPSSPLELPPSTADRPPGTILDRGPEPAEDGEQDRSGPAPLAIAAVAFVLVAGIGAIAALLLLDDGDEAAFDPANPPVVEADGPATGGISSREADEEDPASPTTGTVGSEEAGDDIDGADDDQAPAPDGDDTDDDQNDGDDTDDDQGDGDQATSTTADSAPGGVTTSPSSGNGTTATTAPSTTSTTPTPIQIPSGQITAIASSSLPSTGSITYGPTNVLDGDLSTAWNDNTGVGTGAGQFLRFDFAQPVDLLSIDVVNGYAKNNQVFTRNEAAKTVRLTTDTGVTVEATLSKTTARQTIEIDAPGAKRVTLTVVDVHPGEEFNDLEPFFDLAITNVFFTAAA